MCISSQFSIGSVITVLSWELSVTLDETFCLDALERALRPTRQVDCLTSEYSAPQTLFPTPFPADPLNSEVLVFRMLLHRATQEKFS